MKKFRFKIFALFLLVAGLSIPFSGCGGGRDSNTLEIRYFVGGFGPEWMQSAKEKFEKANPGVTVKPVEDQNIKTSIATYLKSGRQLSDIYFTQDCDWQYFVTQGWVEPLDDVFDTEVSKLDGTKVKIKDYIESSRSEMPYMTMRPGIGQARPWMMPWSVLNCGMMYNEDILLKTPKAGGGFWTAPPATMSELNAYIADLNGANLKNSAGKTVVPFSIGLNQGQWWLTFPLKVWWAQYQGVVTPNTENVDAKQGSFFDFWDFGAPEYDFSKNGNVWAQDGIANALDVLKSILVDPATQKYKNTIDKCDEKSGVDAEKAFVNGESAFIFVGNWIENEMRDFMPDNFKMKAMYVPSIDEAQKNPETGEPYKINNNGESDLILIPSQAPNKELAKKFLTFINSEEMLLDFTKYTGVARPFNYDPLDAEKDGFTFSTYVKSALDLYTNADYNLFEFPINKGGVKDEEERKEFVSYIFTYKRPELFQSIGSGPSLNGILTKSGKEIMKAVVDKTNEDYATWISELGIDSLK